MGLVLSTLHVLSSLIFTFILKLFYYVLDLFSKYLAWRQFFVHLFCFLIETPLQF